MPAGRGWKPRYAGRDWKQERCRWPECHLCDIPEGGLTRAGGIAAAPGVTASVRGLNGDSRARGGSPESCGRVPISDRPVGCRVFHRKWRLVRLGRRRRSAVWLGTAGRTHKRETTRTRISRMSQIARRLCSVVMPNGGGRSPSCSHPRTLRNPPDPRSSLLAVDAAPARHAAIATWSTRRTPSRRWQLTARRSRFTVLEPEEGSLRVEPDRPEPTGRGSRMPPWAARRTPRPHRSMFARLKSARSNDIGRSDCSINRSMANRRERSR